MAMKILIRDDAAAYYRKYIILHHQPVNWDWYATLEQIQGRWLEVETAFLFNDQFNTAPIPGVSEKGLRIMATGPAIAVEVRNDERPGLSRCQYCGKTTPTAQVMQYNAGRFGVDNPGDMPREQQACPRCSEVGYLTHWTAENVLPKPGPPPEEKPKETRLDIFCRNFNITAEVKAGEEQHGPGPGFHGKVNEYKGFAVTFTIKDDGKTRKAGPFDYFIHNTQIYTPSAADVLSSLLSDLDAGEQTFDDFCDDGGYNDGHLNPAEVLSIYTACQENGKKIKAFLGDWIGVAQKCAEDY